MSKRDILIRYASLVVSGGFVALLVGYILLMIPLYKWVFTAEHSFSETVLILINEFIDIGIILFLLWIIIAVPREAFKYTSRSRP